ncbi:RUN and FYVE domain-containing protein 2-like isoform X2 [Liolophura sinensis]|uniref:RUN and FYVE domain-containing protein 2-like isoform X2 n=1 Tax=Liolophura sinensis TaxID=3198878 RepID=UPI003158C432
MAATIETSTGQLRDEEASVHTPQGNGDPGSNTNSWPAPVIASNDQRIPMFKSRRKRTSRDPITVERANLLTMSKLIIKELIDSSLSQGRMLDDDHVPLQQFFVVLEHVLRHGLKPKKGILRDKREFWCVLEAIEKFAPEAAEMTTSVKDMPNVKTPLGRARAWLRIALMQKTLADYFKMLIEKREEILMECYEPGAIMLEEEGMVISGLLVGLNVIDFNLCIKEEDLDQPMGVIDFSLYLKDNVGMDASLDADSMEGKSRMATILDQKNYLEELNRHLNATVTNLQQKLEVSQTTNALMKEDLAIAKNHSLTLQAENEVLRQEKNQLLDNYEKQLQVARQDIDTERQTYQTSSAGLDNMYSDIKKKYEEETQLRVDVEKELELQISMKQEMEMALQLLEKDIHEKQDNIVTLRQQLDEIKAINLEMYNKLQTCDSTLKHKAEMVVKLEEKTNQLVATMKDMEKKLKQCESDKQAAMETARKLGQTVAEKDSLRTALETDLKIEREWRGTLQKTLEQEKEKLGSVQMDLQKMKDLEKDYTGLQERHQLLQQTCDDHERTLAELGSHLSESKLKMEDLRESHLQQKEAQWASDKEATHCKQCSKPFSVARRKHHCRNCGDIYCSECSDNKMPHPSSSKPVRVCDSCQDILLQRYSAQ